MTNTTTTPPVTVVFSGASFITMTATTAPTSVEQMTSGQQDVILPPQLIQRDTLRGLLASHVCHSSHDLSLISLPRHMPTMPWVLHR